MVTALSASLASAQVDPLVSWNEGATKSAIIDFVTAVTDETSKNYVPPAERIVIFDNDGTLWVEAPLYTQVMFAFDRVKAMAPDHPGWKDKPALDAVLKGDMKAVAKAVAIQRFIGRRPIASFGNADHDIPMIQWTLAGDGRRLGMLVHHTDADREFAYDRKSIVGTLDKGIDEAATSGWHLIDMKKDWKVVFTPKSSCGVWCQYSIETSSPDYS